MVPEEPPGYGRKERSIIHLFRQILAGARRAPVPEALRMTLYDFRHFFCSEHAAPGPQHMEIEALSADIGHRHASTQTLLRWYADQRRSRRGPHPTRSFTLVRSQQVTNARAIGEGYKATMIEAWAV